jgi:hypothetical protein
VRSAQLPRPAMSWPLHPAGHSSPSPGTRPTRSSSYLARRKHGRRCPWHALEEILDFPRGRDWVLIGSLYSTGSRQGSLDEHLKRATAGWVAVVLEKAAVITIDRSRPAQIKLRSG